MLYLLLFLKYCYIYTNTLNLIAIFLTIPFNINIWEWDKGGVGHLIKITISKSKKIIESNQENLIYNFLKSRV